MPELEQQEPPSVVDRFLRLFSHVRAGESTTALLMATNIFLILVGYYIIKTIREPLILNTGGAEMKSYAAGGQALVLMGFIPLYSWFSSRVDRARLLLGFNLFFIVGLELFYLAGRAEIPYTGIAFFVWVGIFNLAIIAQFWSFANDIYSREAGERLFPIIVVGMNAGPPIGSKIAELLFEADVDPYDMMHLGTVSLVLSLSLYWVVNRREERSPRGRAEAGEVLSRAVGGFGLILRNRYVQLIAVTLVLANLVNTTGEYILSSLVVERAAEVETTSRDAFVGSFYGNFFFWVNILTVLIQLFLASRLVKYLGIAGVLFALPLVALSAYGLIAVGVGFALTRWLKTAENATDYSLMNTAKAMLWLPTTRDEKYKAKQAVDTFFVRAGDVLSAGLVYGGTQILTLSVTGFASVNVGLIAVWLFVAYRLWRSNRSLAETEREAAVRAA